MLDRHVSPRISNVIGKYKAISLRGRYLK